MARVVLVGSDVALLEGLAQMLAAAGHRPNVTTSAAAHETLRANPPLVLLAERRLGGELSRSPLSPGGALVLFRTADDEDTTALPAAAQRAALADLTLPLERHRLLALVAYVEERAETTGRTRIQTPPAHTAL